jgi:hypothetical protein
MRGAGLRRSEASRTHRPLLRAGVASAAVALGAVGVARAESSLDAAPPLAPPAPAAAPPAPPAAAPPAPPAAAAPQRPTRTERAPKGRSVAWDIGLATAFPVMVLGVESVLELPYGFQLRADVGWLGTPYVEAIDSTLLALGAYGSGSTAEATSELIRAALRNSLTGRVGVGIRPIPSSGFELFGGYTFDALGGSLGPKAAIEAVTGQSFPNDSVALEARIRSALHSVHVGVGWRWVIEESVVIRASLEYLQTLASSTEVWLDGPKGQRAVPPISEATNAYLNGIFTTWVKAPVVSVSAGFRF